MTSGQIRGAHLIRPSKIDHGEFMAHRLGPVCRTSLDGINREPSLIAQVSKLAIVPTRASWSRQLAPDLRFIAWLRRSPLAIHRPRKQTNDPASTF